MRLKDYLESRKFTYEEFALLANCSASAIAKYALGLRVPKKAIRDKIIEVTNGKVGLADLMLK